MTEIREIGADQTKLAAATLLELRPRWGTSDALTHFVDTELRPRGYRLAGVFLPDDDSAVSVLGFREAWHTAWGHHLYVDDLITAATARGHGHADLLMSWAKQEARRLNCEAIHLDSGVGPDRAPAHRLYMRNHLSITAHHFTVQADSY
ncbi:acetyltransferase (GNAT) family protein [Nocardia tenerifensis]|uniref:Acetyltransferase (GNAT) family protein n=1 Tax=Nocardia tenerifensis TaxID=228006 RepID=A0A318KC44_9NOCA|nr:GNAT family N-acetyltransferase [Nocardia tenerifensis]PXX69086.1 acetyltransferase (GNAT) family protein [Nocardia tenerifensis]